ncbi:hypothetical protein [Spirosoma agri]|uniref:RHS repeat-associated core domain-containing protein n=1 Tax=Spirosoma agri TaxID=1987381 RepID=A0A6M0IIA3_9BACT|nr:hypothetical protein [Spirosoma agri]NEU67081.1 hypothetical protein [Spirosoma agri]
MSSYTFQGKSKPGLNLNDSRSTEAYTYSYNERGIATGVHYTFSSSVTSSTGIISSRTGESKSTSELDQNDFVIKKTVENNSSYYDASNSTTYKQQSIVKTVYQYDSNGRVVGGDITYTSPATQKVYATSRVDYKYDNAGKLSIYTLKDFSDGRTFTYNYYFTNDVLTKYTVISPNSTQEIEPVKLDKAGHFVRYGTDDFFEKFAYDEKGNIILWIGSGSTTSSFDIYEYEYDSMKNPFLLNIPSKGHPNVGLFNRPDFQRNANNIIKKSHRYNEYETPEITLFNLTYNSAGLLTSSVAKDGTESRQYDYINCN